MVVNTGWKCASRREHHDSVPSEPDGSRPGDYATEARTYDLTRGASPTIVRLVAGFLGPPAGRRLLDVGGGTGNYAQVLQARGFDVVVLDAELAMLRLSVPKVGRGRQVGGDASALPVASRSFDAAVMIHVMHLMPDPAVSFREVRRVLREGPLVLVDSLRENVPPFVQEYFGLDASDDDRPSISAVEERLKGSGFDRIEHQRLVYTDTADGSLRALHTKALHLAGPAYLRNTTFWWQLDDGARRSGLEALARALRSGELERRVKDHMTTAAGIGHETVVAAWP